MNPKAPEDPVETYDRIHVIEMMTFLTKIVRVERCK